jgi:hypothetical protein
MNRLYQWLGGRASALFSARPEQETGRTVRTEIRVQRESVTVLVGAATRTVGACPLCGQKLAPEPVKQPALRLVEGSSSKEFTPEDDLSL